MNHTYDVHLLPLSFKRKHLQSVIKLILMISLISVAFTKKVSADEVKPTGPDAQKIWDKTCSSCHGNSADIARNYLSVVDGQLQGPMHKTTFRKFLTNHYLSEMKADAIYSMLLTQATTKPRYEVECSSCHKSAADFVRESFVLRKGLLHGKKSGTPTRYFLEKHRDLKKEDVDFFMNELTVMGYKIYLPQLAR